MLSSTVRTLTACPTSSWASSSSDRTRPIHQIYSFRYRCLWETETISRSFLRLIITMLRLFETSMSNTVENASRCELLLCCLHDTNLNLHPERWSFCWNLKSDHKAHNPSISALLQSLSRISYDYLLGWKCDTKSRIIFLHSRPSFLFFYFSGCMDGYPSHIDCWPSLHQRNC